MIVILDSNIWIRDFPLMSDVGRTVCFYIRKQNARIGLPEVVRLETELHMREILNKHIHKVEKGYRKLLAAFGRLKEIVLPNEEEIDELIAGVFSNLGVDVEEIPFTLDSARASLVRTVKKLPPSDRNQQFKDGVIWADCLTMLKKERVFLVTEDKAFYKGHDPNQGLANELKETTKGLPHKLDIFETLGGLLAEIGTKVDIEEGILVNAYLAMHGEKIDELAARHSLALEGTPMAEQNFFVTENPATLFVEFTIEFPCVDTTDEGRIEAKIIVQGDGMYDVDLQQFVKLNNLGEKLLYQLPDGTEKKMENVVIRVGSIVIGHREVEYSVRHKLP